MDGNNVTYNYHGGGRISEIYDGTGYRKLEYDALGNLTRETREIAIPNSDRALVFATDYIYDSWGRMRSMTYPDGEQVTYSYRWGGDLFSVHGTKGADSCRYVDSIAYNAYGQRSYIHYGNGTMASYTYDALHRLIGLESRDSLGDPMQQIKYDFDPSSNITHIANNAPHIGPLGGRYQNYYKYDPLHRLTRAGGSDHYGFEQAFELSRAGRPLSMSTNGKVKHYAYGEHTPPHAPQRIMVEEGFRHTLHDLRWDPAGNLGQVSTLAHGRGDIQSRFLFWTEDSRLHTVVDDRHHSYYAYDHTGERTLKVTGHSHQLDVNADLMHTVAGLDEFTLYPSPYLVFTNRGYTKHYYAGTERLAARIGGGFDRPILREQTDIAMTATHLFKQSQHHSNERHLNAPPAHTIRRDHLSENIYMDMMREFEIPMHLVTDAVIKSNNLLSTAQNIVSGSAEPDVYFYHSDHLGSASWITDSAGTPIQHLQYLPYGEPFVNQRAAGSTYSERFRFTGKERDEETGYGYFGARYMDHELMTMWLSVDPLADKYPSLSPYNYCAWNPMKLVDPDGREIVIIGENGEKTTYTQGMSTKGLDKFTKKVVSHLNDMCGTRSGREVVSELISSKRTYTYTNKDEKNPLGRASFNDVKRIFSMGKAESRDYAHETFHAYQYEMGMRGQTATREVGARLFEAMMCDQIASWKAYAFTGLNGGSNFSTAMMNLFLNGFNMKDYDVACQSFLTESQGGEAYRKLGYWQGIPLHFPPIQKFLKGGRQE